MGRKFAGKKAGLAEAGKFAAKKAGRKFAGKFGGKKAGIKKIVAKFRGKKAGKKAGKKFFHIIRKIAGKKILKHIKKVVTSHQKAQEEDGPQEDHTSFQEALWE